MIKCLEVSIFYFVLLYSYIIAVFNYHTVTYFLASLFNCIKVSREGERVRKIKSERRLPQNRLLNLRKQYLGQPVET